MPYRAPDGAGSDANWTGERGKLGPDRVDDFRVGLDLEPLLQPPDASSAGGLGEV